MQIMRIVTVGLALALGCAARPTPIPDGESSAATIYRARCGVCHSVPHPKRNYYSQWENLIDVMEERIEHREMPPISDADRDVILAYLREHAR